MVVVAVKMGVQEFLRSEDSDRMKVCLLASIFKSHRNNEMIKWFAKYFL
jgi:hypothetical protein